MLDDNLYDYEELLLDIPFVPKKQIPLLEFPTSESQKQEETYKLLKIYYKQSAQQHLS